jgi:acyl-CoA thioester hydrolase
MHIDEYPSRLSLRIDWSDLDYFGHVNNVSFFRFIQSARVRYWDLLGLTESHRKTNVGPMLVSCQCNFKKPLLYPGNITLMSKMEFIRNTSFSISHLILNQANELAAEALDVMVMFDFNKNEKALFPEGLREAVMRVEGKTF